MAINRALMNRQMYNMGGPSRPRQMYDMGGSSLQAGAPDLRLTGDVRPTYTQGRKNRMDMAFGGIAGLDGRKRYGIGSWFQETIMDPIKNNPVTSAVIGGGLLNEFGLPNFITEGDNFIGDYFSNDAGKNFLGLNNLKQIRHEMNTDLHKRNKDKMQQTFLKHQQQEQQQEHT